MTDLAAPGDLDQHSARLQKQQASVQSDGLLTLVKNLSHYHREHEKYYSEAPLSDAVSLQRTARTLIALAERWTSAEPVAEPAPSPYAGTPDLNDDRATETSGAVHGGRG